MKFLSSDPTSPGEEAISNGSGEPSTLPPEPISDPPNPWQAPEKTDEEDDSKGGLFSRKPKKPKDEDKDSKKEARKEKREREKKEKEEKKLEKKRKKEEGKAKKASDKIGQPSKGRFSLFGRKDKTPIEPFPTELVHVEGERVLVPSSEDIETYKSITYPVLEPYQFVNLRYEEGVLVYNLIEPTLMSRERAILKKVNEAFDMLINVNTVLITTEDKLHFLEDTFKDILKIYNYKLNEVTYQRLLYHIERDYVGYGRIDALIRDRFIEDISCNGPGTSVFVYHRFFESIKTNVIFDELELNNFLLRLAQLSGRHISILQPIRDAALPDGSRVNMTLGKEVTKKGSTFTIRKFRSEPISPIEIAMLHTADSRIYAYLWMLVEYGRSFLISGGTAAGKSVPYEEQVLVYRSGRPTLVRIGELYDELASSGAKATNRSGYDSVSCNDVETPAFNSELKVDRFKVASIVRHPADKAIFRLKTRSGRTISTTGDHSIFTIADGDIVPYPVSEMSPGMYVAVPRSIPDPGNEPGSLNLVELLSQQDWGMYVENVAGTARLAIAAIGAKETARALGVTEASLRIGISRDFLAVRVSRFAELLKKIPLEVGLGDLRIRPKTSRKYGLPCLLPITKSMMRFMGYWTADGDYQKGVTVFQVEKRIRDDMARCGEEAFGIPGHRNPGDYMRIDFKCTALEALFKSLYGPGKGAAAKNIPAIAFRQGNDLLAEFLRAYYTGGGHAHRAIEATTKSRRLAIQLLYALGRYGIVASVRPKFVKGREYHTVCIYGQKNLKLFESQIGFLNKRNRISLARFANRTISPHTNVDTIPGLSGLLKQALAFKEGEDRKQLWSAWHPYWSAPGSKNMGRQALLSYLADSGATGNVKESLARLAYSDIFWDEVEEIEEVPYSGKYVYDLEVPGAQNFVGGEGGVFLHNTTLLNSITMLVKPEAKIVSVEDTPEINIAHPNWIQAVTRVGFGESGGAISGVSGISGVSTHGKGAGDISLYDLLISALRQRPDFIIVGEVRGEEAYTLFQAISVGHATMGTIHAASMAELLARTESQPMNVPRVLFANLDIVIFVAAVRKGEEKVRRIREIIEILGINPSTKEVITNTVFRWDPTKDYFEYTGRSFQMEKISKSTGTPLATLEAEVANRAALFERMRKEGITNYRLVTDVVRQYYLDRVSLMKAQQLTKLIPTTDQTHEDWGNLRK
jgi:type IV secretory pathway ATPase VirB11/archaellum biosynthesis ATPase/intein/homing endonuclease